MNNAASCRCCLSRPPDKQLGAKHMWLGISEVYGDMLRKCFDIQLKVGLISGDAGICNVCVGRLRDAFIFKIQVLQCQQDFEVVVNKALNLKDEGPKIMIKLEDVDDDTNDVFRDIKSEAVDQTSDEDDKNLSLLAIKQRNNKELTVRRLNRLPEACHVNQIARPTRPAKSSIKRVNSATSLSEFARLQINANLLFKYSNVTPFSTKSIAGIVCVFCRETLPTMAALRAHTREKHENDKIPINSKNNSLYLKMDILDLRCKLCNKDIDVISTLKKHLTQQHRIRFEILKNYIVEFKLTDTDPMNCARCNSNFETFKTLLQHMSRHYRNYVCEKCAAGFINMQKLKLHMMTHEAGSHKCSKCDKVFKSVMHVREHEKCHKGKRVTKCPHCDQIFHSYSLRNSHMLKVHKTAAATYKCKVCDRGFMVKSSLTMHIKRDHLMERNHICRVCESAFFTRQLLLRHMVTHSGDRVYQCAVCNKTYARKNTLREHMRIHDNDRRFQCGICSLRFVQKCSLKAHMMSNHGLALSECYSENEVYTSKSSPDDKPAK